MHQLRLEPARVQLAMRGLPDGGLPDPHERAAGGNIRRTCGQFLFAGHQQASSALHRRESRTTDHSAAVSPRRSQKQLVSEVPQR